MRPGFVRYAAVMKLTLTFVAMSLAASACAKQAPAPTIPQMVRERPVDLRHLCEDERYAGLCTPASVEMPTVIDTNTTGPRPVRTVFVAAR